MKLVLSTSDFCEEVSGEGLANQHFSIVCLGASVLVRATPKYNLTFA